jgi:hypothetical protein
MPLPKLKVSQGDLDDLLKSGLTPPTIFYNHIYTETNRDDLARLLRRSASWDMPEFCLHGGLVFPYHGLDGKLMHFDGPDGLVYSFARVKPHVPRRNSKGDPIKYEQPKKSPLRAYFPAKSLPLLRDGKSVVIPVEGEKKALCVSQLGFAAVGIGGIWAWKTDDELIPDLKALPWKGCRVVVCFDWDETAEKRANCAQAARGLARALRKEGAEVYLIDLPPGKDGAKQGVDDYIVANGADAFRALVEQAKPAPTGPLFGNFTDKTVKDAKGKEKTVSDGKTLAQVHKQLQEFVGDRLKRVGALLFGVEGYEQRWLPRVEDLFAWVGGKLPEPVQWQQGTGMPTKAEFAAYLRQAAEEVKAVETLPHWPVLDGHLYLHPPLGHNYGRMLDALIDRFSPATKTDRSLMKAAILSLFWGGGKRPVFLLEGEPDDPQGGRGVGKSTFAEMLALLAGGHFDAKPDEDFDKLVSRLLSPAALGLRCCLLDNVKKLRFSWGDFEGLVTSDTISGRQLYVGEGRRPNTLVWFLTINHGSLSKDMAQRVVIIRVKRPKYDDAWEKKTRQFIELHRWEIVGDVIAALSEQTGENARLECFEKTRLKRFTRWAEWEKDVLACCPDAAECQRVIAERQADVDGDQDEADQVRDQFVAELRRRGHSPENDVVFIPSSTATDIYNGALGTKEHKQRAKELLTKLNIVELKYRRRHGGVRGFVWTGKNADPNRPPVEIGPWRPGDAGDAGDASAKTPKSGKEAK